MAFSRSGWSAISSSNTISARLPARNAVFTFMPAAALRWQEAASTRSPSIFDHAGGSYRRRDSRARECQQNAGCWCPGAAGDPPDGLDRPPPRPPCRSVKVIFRSVCLQNRIDACAWCLRAVAGAAAHSVRAAVSSRGAISRCAARCDMRTLPQQSLRLGDARRNRGIRGVRFGRFIERLLAANWCEAPPPASMRPNAVAPDVAVRRQIELGEFSRSWGRGQPSS